MDTTFVEIAVYQMKPTKVDEFERLLERIVAVQKQQDGLIDLKYVKREYRIDYDQIKEGLPPLKLTKIVKCVKYILIWEFETKEQYGKALQNLYLEFEKELNRCLVAPHDKLLGERLY